MKAEVVGLLGLIALVAGVWVLWGLGGALLVFGVYLVMLSIALNE